jgi:hypothetical protein
MAAGGGRTAGEGVAGAAAGCMAWGCWLGPDGGVALAGEVSPAVSAGWRAASGVDGRAVADGAPADGGSATADGLTASDPQPEGGGMMPMGARTCGGEIGGRESCGAAGGVASDAAGLPGDGGVTIGEGTAGPGTI